jgi:hypothetical protein
LGVALPPQVLELRAKERSFDATKQRVRSVSNYGVGGVPVNVHKMEREGRGRVRLKTNAAGAPYQRRTRIAAQLSTYLAPR